MAASCYRHRLNPVREQGAGYSGSVPIRTPPLPGLRPITIRGGGDPSQNMVIEPFVRMGPPPRSLAAEANDCFMVRTQYGYNRIQVCGAGTGAQRQVPLGSFCYLSPLCHRPASADFRAAVMDCAKEDAAYEMPLTSKRPYKFWPMRDRRRQCVIRHRAERPAPLRLQQGGTVAIHTRA